MSNYFDELEKIANESIIAEDIMDPMAPDVQPHVDPEEVEAIQAQNAEEISPVTQAEGQLPASPEDVAAAEAALAGAQQELEVAKQAQEDAEQAFQAFEKQATYLTEQLPYMGALAELLVTSATEGDLQKLAQERLTEAFQSEEGYAEVLEKTASELLSREENVDHLFSRQGTEYVIEQLAAFNEDEELEKVALDMGGVFHAVKGTTDEYVNATRNFFKLKDEIDAAKAHVDELNTIVGEKAQELQKAKEVGDPASIGNLTQEYGQATKDWTEAVQTHDDLKDQRVKGGAVLGTAGVAVPSASLFAGKKIYDNQQNSSKEPEEVLSDKTASVKMDGETSVSQKKGGTNKMGNQLVQDFLKIAGAAFLIETANDENQEEGVRKEASDMYNSIARLGAGEIGDALAKVAMSNYSEDQLTEVVQGHHNEELFNKVAGAIQLYEMSADELEKVANADGVAAKGMGGALTDAKKNIEEKIKQDKEKTESVATGEIGSKKADDTRGYNVINNPGSYQVDKTASLEQAHMQKQAAYEAFVAADVFIRQNS